MKNENEEEWEEYPLNRNYYVSNMGRVKVTPLFNIKKMNREQRELQKILQDAVVHAGYERVKNALKLLCE